jgi:signal transduction histidine kinase
VTALDVKCVCAFSLMPGQSFAEAQLFDEKGDVLQSLLIDCEQRPATPIKGDGPVLPAGQEMEWLMASISPQLTSGSRFWICLEAEGGAIGGVVWGAQAGEAQRLSVQAAELSGMASGWALALRTAQIREEARMLSEQLAETNRQLQNAQSEIVRTRMIASVGEMAAGAAHEMNNPLAIISGRSQLLASVLSDPKLQLSAKSIYEQSHRLTDIITELMDYAKPVPPAPRNTDLAEMVEHAIKDAKERCNPADRKLEITMGELPEVAVDPQQVGAALREVIENAIQATDEKSGQIAIHAAHDPYSSRVVVTVSDNGCGMDEKTLKQAFDPFYSHKQAGRRRGMGLAKALRWVESSGGSIRLESRPGEGTRALILLPAAASATQPIMTERKRVAQ